MMPTIRVIRVDYADGSWYHTDFQDFKVFNTDDFIKFILSHRNYDFHIRALNAESERVPEAVLSCVDIITAYNKPPQEILMSAFNYIWENKEVHDV
ncbi:hypothetical protein [Phage Phass-1]|uniref:Uncharacterized protein n=1 Tax=Phage Phass-1 TaxID=3043662 RepID=A0AAF0LWT3_9CAUD|nr:hypothetical protein [Phage Phass-1]